MSTGYMRPGIMKMGAPSKYSENFCASIVALLMSSLMSSRKRQMSFTRPKSTSVCSVRSCASSMIMAE